MRFSPLVAAILLLSLSTPASAQEWIEYVSKEDRFTGNFPGQPRVTQTTYTEHSVRRRCQRASTAPRRGRAGTR